MRGTKDLALAALEKLREASRSDLNLTTQILRFAQNDSPDEVAFYDALEVPTRSAEEDDNAVKVLGDEAILAPERDSSLRSE